MMSISAGTYLAMEVSLDEKLAPMAIEKIKILGAVLELLAKQPPQPSPFTSIL